MKLDGSPRNAWTVILGTGGRNPPEQMDDFPGICIIMGNMYSTGNFGKLFRVSQIHFKKRQKQG
jgi:hypothetical protein